jgi:hypothetical protein
MHIGKCLQHPLYLLFIYYLLLVYSFNDCANTSEYVALKYRATVQSSRSPTDIWTMYLVDVKQYSASNPYLLVLIYLCFINMKQSKI